MLKNILKTLKINHYIKNAVVFVPLIFSMNFTHIPQIINSLIIFVSFCLVSSAAYIVNDLIDIEKDKQHPIKKTRPIPSGKISIRAAITLISILLVSSLIIVYQINILSSTTILLYFILNIFYSVWLKHMAIIDATCIAVGFILRILAGCFAISVLPSPLVILLTFFISNFFTFAKRKLELKLLEGKIIRNSLNEMSLETINHFILINAILSISFYITYVLDSTTMERAGSQYLFITVIPFTLIIYRLFLLIETVDSIDDPMFFIEKDTIIKYLFIVYLIVLLILLAIG